MDRSIERIKNPCVSSCKENCSCLLNSAGACHWFLIGRKSLTLKPSRISEYSNIKISLTVVDRHFN